MTLELRDVGWNAGFKKIISDVSLRVEPGEFLGLIGPNGSGKTSLMSVLAGIRAPSRGQALLDGQAMKKSGVAIWRDGSALLNNRPTPLTALPCARRWHWAERRI